LAKDSGASQHEKVLTEIARIGSEGTRIDTPFKLGVTINDSMVRRLKVKWQSTGGDV